MMNNKLTTLIYLLLIQLSFVTPASAVNTIQVMALFNGKAVLKIDKVQHTLSIGDTSPEGVKLVSADSEKAVLEVDGQKKTYKMGNAVSIGTQYSKPTERVSQAFADRHGMYFIQGSANGYPIKFLIDTGATSIAMNSVHADRLGIDYKLIGKQGLVSTASGIAKAYSITLNKVKVGEIELRNVAAVILDGGFPTEVLLGMSFLGRVTVEREGNLMRIIKKY
ncbi:MAG: TIGR02281 family clan AA aspartic protease [Gammaproteobacteria bacterium]|nr:TIGR02281 family clan AA aspartic protease [Gammaproteobacteria bacterium]